MALETFRNLPSTTVSSGGTTAPAPGTVETWTVASSAAFPAASSSGSPPTQFHVADVAANSEIIAVTNVSGTTWTVTRGAESTTPVAHTAGFSVFQVATAGWLGSTSNAALRVTVSPAGLATGAATTNNGADYGPDTASTVTSGIQEAINYVIAQELAGHPGYEIVLLPGKFTLSTFSNTTYRAALVADAGYAVTGGPPVTVSIRGALPVTGLLNGTTFANSYQLGATILDASHLDVLAQGLFKQGRVIFVVPYSGAVAPCGAVQLKVSDLAIIVPTYNANGTGPGPYVMGSGYANMSLFISGNTQASNGNHFLFVNGIDAWGATSCQIENVAVLSALAAYNADGNQFAGSGGVQPLGSAAAFVFPGAANEGNVMGRRLSTIDTPVGVQNAAHLSCDQMYAQYVRAAIYDHEAGHGAIYHRINVQQSATMVQHAMLPQLTNSLSGHSVWDPTGDEYALIGQGFPASASTSSLIITQASIEAATQFLADDNSNPLTVVANVEASAQGFVAADYGAGANLMVNFISEAVTAQTVLNGTTAGTATWTQSGNTPWDKRTVVYLNGYRNSTVTAQTITFTIAYNNPPAVIKDATGAATVSATQLTLPASMGSPVTGYIILEGY